MTTLIAQNEKKSLYHDENKVVKVFHKMVSKADVLNEAAIHVRIESLPTLHIPKLLEVSVYEQKWSLVYEHIDGVTLQALMDQHPERVAYYLDLMVDLQISIHQQNCPLLHPLKDKMSRQISELEDLTQIEEFDLLTRLQGMKTHTKLCHGDFHPSNILVTADETLYVIDWNHAAKGNASADVARTYLLLCLENQEKADTYLKTFCEKTQTNQSYVQEWLPLVAAAQLSKKRPQEEPLLKQWLSVVDYQ